MKSEQWHELEQAVESIKKTTQAIDRFNRAMQELGGYTSLSGEAPNQLILAINQEGMDDADES